MSKWEYFIIMCPIIAYISLLNLGFPDVKDDIDTAITYYIALVFGSISIAFLMWAAVEHVKGNDE
jgi:hypothetical protein